MKKRKSKWNIVLLTLIMLWFVSLIVSNLMSYSSLETGNVALIKIFGTITADGKPMVGKGFTTSTTTIHFIEEADKNPAVKAIIFEINSPGGSAVASKEIVDAIKRVNKTTVALIREIGTSGAYWIASATEYVIANDLSITGSIGVISSYLELSKLFDKYGITYTRLVSGEYKDIASPFRNLTSDERNILQKQLDIIHDYFIADVANNRDVDYEYMKSISTGMFYLGNEAVELQLVDGLGDMNTAKLYIKNTLNLTAVEIAEYSLRPTFLDSLLNAFSDQSFSVGRGIGESFIAKANNNLNLI